MVDFPREFSEKYQNIFAQVVYFPPPQVTDDYIAKKKGKHNDFLFGENSSKKKWDKTVLAKTEIVNISNITEVIWNPINIFLDDLKGIFVIFFFSGHFLLLNIFLKMEFKVNLLLNCSNTTLHFH